MQAIRPLTLTAVGLAALLSLAGCGERSDTTTVGQKADSAVDRTGQAARSAREEGRESLASGAAAARDKAGDLAAAARDKAGDAAANARERADTAIDSTRSAATTSSGDTSVMGAAREARDQAYGNPGSGTSAKDDARIQSMVIKGLKADKDLNPLRIDVDAREGVVTLSGSVPTAAARAKASEIARNVKDVKSVNDQLTLNAS